MHFQTNEWTEVAFVFLPSNDKHRPHQYRSFFLGCFRFQFKVFIFSSFFLHFWIVRDILVPKYEQNDYVQGFGAWIFQEHQSNREQVRFEIQIINNFFSLVEEFTEFQSNQKWKIHYLFQIFVKVFHTIFTRWIRGWPMCSGKFPMVLIITFGAIKSRESPIQNDAKATKASRWWI